jgi:predicted oxidoreductase
VKFIRLGPTTQQVPNVVLGLMRIAEMSDQAVRDLVGTARDAGIDFFDHADISANMQVVVGTTTPERLKGAAAGSDLPLTRAEWYELFQAAGHRAP